MTSSVSTFEICDHSGRNFTSRGNLKPFRGLSWGVRINAQWSNTRTQELDIGYMDKLATLIEKHHTV